MLTILEKKIRKFWEKIYFVVFKIFGKYDAWEASHKARVHVHCNPKLELIGVHWQEFVWHIKYNINVI